MRSLRRLAVFVLALPVLYLLAGFAGALIPSGADWPAEGLRVGLLRGPIHYDFLLPLDHDTRADFAFAQSVSGLPLNAPNARWLAVGWGSEAFYTTAGSYADVELSAVWRASTGDRAVMRLEVLGTLPETDQPGLHWFRVTPDQFAKLRQSLLDSLERDISGRPILSGAAGLGETDRFWLARGRFDLARTCNVWIGRQLRAAGLRFGIWTPTPKSIDLSLWAFGH